MASKRHKRRKACSTKIRHNSEQDAQYACYLYRKDTGDKNLSVYHCKFCGGYHFGHYHNRH